MTTKFTITPESILHTDIKLMIQNNYTKYPNHRLRYEFYCSYGLFWDNQDYINKTIKDVVDAFGMRYLVVPTIGENLEKQIAIIFDTSSSLFVDTYMRMDSDEKHNLYGHCENQKKEINLLLKQKEKLEKELEACKNHKIDMMAYRDDIIGKISREKNELENANSSQLRYINEMEANMKKGNEEYKKLKDEYDRLEEAYEKRRSQTLKYHSVYDFEQLKKQKEYYRKKVHELFAMLLAAEFRQKQEEKEENTAY